MSLNENKFLSLIWVSLICAFGVVGCASTPDVADAPPIPVGANEAPAVAACRVFTSVEDPLEFDDCVESVTSDGTLILKPEAMKAVQVSIGRKQGENRTKHLWLMLANEKSPSLIFTGPIVAYIGQGPSGVNLARQVAYFDNGPDYFSEGLARSIAKNGKVGFIDDRLTTVIREDYDFAAPFKNGFTVACVGCASQKSGEHPIVEGGQWLVVNKNGMVVKGPGLSQTDAYAALETFKKSKPALKADRP